MKLSRREWALAWITMVIVALGGTYWFGAPRLKASQDVVREMEALSQRIAHIQSLLDERGSWDERLEAVRKQLPRHPASKDVTSELLRSLEQTAQQHGLSLLRREPDKEKDLGDLFEVSIDCTWEGTLDALVHFLYAIQLQGVILDIRSLTVNPMEGGPDRLKGSFTVVVAYTRVGGAATP